MQQLLCQIMMNDTLRKAFRKEYVYERGLGMAEKQAVEETEDGGGTALTIFEKFFQAMADFFENLIEAIVRIPVFVWILLGVVLLAVLFVWMYRSGLFGSYSRLRNQSLTEADNIYEIDFQPELEEALARADYAEALRLRYLRTLRTLADGGHVVWRIYKTPTQFAAEAASRPFSEMTRHFLWVRYGRYDADEALYRRVDTLAQEVEREKGGEV